MQSFKIINIITKGKFKFFKNNFQKNQNCKYLKKYDEIQDL